jgi:hypothetical protein
MHNGAGDKLSIFSRRDVKRKFYFLFTTYQHHDTVFDEYNSRTDWYGLDLGLRSLYTLEFLVLRWNVAAKNGSAMYVSRGTGGNLSVPQFGYYLSAWLPV